VQLRYLQTMREVTSERNTTTFLPLPFDLFTRCRPSAPRLHCGRSRRSRPFTWSSSYSASRGLNSWRSPGSGCERR